MMGLLFYIRLQDNYPRSNIIKTKTTAIRKTTKEAVRLEFFDTHTHQKTQLTKLWNNLGSGQPTRRTFAENY